LCLRSGSSSSGSGIGGGCSYCEFTGIQKSCQEFSGIERDRNS
jgi:hypothetical protein